MFRIATLALESGLRPDCDLCRARAAVSVSVMWRDTVGRSDARMAPWLDIMLEVMTLLFGGLEGDEMSSELSTPLWARALEARMLGIVLFSVSRAVFARCVRRNDCGCVVAVGCVLPMFFLVYPGYQNTRENS